MLERIDNLPVPVIGVRAVDVVTPSDVRDVLEPAFARASEIGERVRLLYLLGADHVGFSPGPSWLDQHLDVSALRLLERCAIVSDRGWVHEAHGLVATFVPCPLRVFETSDLPEAIHWLQNSELDAVLPHYLVPELSVLVVAPEHRLRTQDFDTISETIDLFVRAHGPLRGIVVRSRSFPGWRNLGAFLRHLRFVREHRRSAERVALAIDGATAEVGQRIARHFVDAELEHFDYDDVELAITWAGMRAPASHTGPDGGDAAP